MRRWRSKTSLRDTPLGLPTLVSGSIRNPGEDEALAVTMSINATGFALHADDVALGNWGIEEVEIVPLGDRAFEFVAEGDRLIFVPDDLEAFMRRVFPEQASRRKKRKPPPPPADEPTPVATASEPTPTPEAPTPAAPTPAPAPEPKAAKKPKAAKSRKVQVSKVKLRRKQVEPAPAYELPNEPPVPEHHDGRWVRSLDSARRYGLFGLDRVPVDEKLRGQDHRHTYDHRAAATSGPGKHICTICGKVRIRTT